MNIVLKRLSALFIAVLFAGTALAVTTMVSAQEGQTGSGLRISPTRSEITLVPGDSTEVVQNVKNVTQSPITVEPSLNDFESDGVTGIPKLIGDPNEISSYSLREFISLPEKFDLQPDEEKELKIAVRTPDNASPGAYFGSVVYRATPQGQSGDGQVSLLASVGSLVLLEVPGDITERISINSVSAYLNDSAGSLFTKKPDAIGIEIENLGNSFSQPFGRVTVTDWRGNEVFGYELNDTLPRGVILPESTRLFLDELYDVEVKNINGQEQIEKTSPLKWPGRYKVQGFISHSLSGEIFNVSTTFWYIPTWLIIVVVVILAVIVFGAYYLYRKYITKSTRRRK